jgi:hypothetical protein
VKSLLVISWGEQTFTGPETLQFGSVKNAMERITSFKLTQLKGCFPSPKMPPIPKKHDHVFSSCDSKCFVHT